jgi:pilus assembly protein CpaB
VRRAETVARARVAAPPSLRVLVAAQPLPTGAIVRPGQVRWQAWPQGASAAGYYTSSTATPEQLTGAVVRTELAAGEPLSPQRLAQPGERSFLSAVLKPGMRAITINVSANTGVGGFIFPGDHVDLILTRPLDGGGAGRRFVSRTLLRDVRVVGMDQRAANEKKEVVAPQTATLEVAPSQAELIALAADLGRLTLSLRSLAEPDTAVAAADSSNAAAQAVSFDPPAARPTRPRADSHAGRPPTAAVTVVRGVDSASGAAR